MCTRSEIEPFKRFKKQCLDYRVPNFSVFRGETFFSIINHIPDYKNLDLCPDREIVDELIQAFFSVIYSRIYKIEELYLVRHIAPIRNEIRERIPNESKKKELQLKSKEFLEKSIFIN